MKKFICLLTLVLFIAVCTAQLPHYEITGNIDGAGIKIGFVNCPAEKICTGFIRDPVTVISISFRF